MRLLLSILAGWLIFYLFFVLIMGVWNPWHWEHHIRLMAALVAFIWIGASALDNRGKR